MDVLLSATLTTRCRTAEEALRACRQLLERAPDRPSNAIEAARQALRALSAVSRLERALKDECAALNPTTTLRALLADSAEETAR